MPPQRSGDDAARQASQPPGLPSEGARLLFHVLYVQVLIVLSVADRFTVPAQQACYEQSCVALVVPFFFGYWPALLRCT